MLVTSKCPSCQTLIKVDDSRESAEMQCPACGELLSIVAGTPPTAAPPLPYGATLQERKAGLAIASLVCGILGFCTSGVLGLAGLILGIVALARANREPHVDHGKGFAIAGIATGSVSFLTIILYGLLIAVLLPSLSSAREAAKRAVCRQQVTAVVSALHVYAEQNDAFPPTLDVLLSSGSISNLHLTCPPAEVPTGSAYQYVAGLTSDCAGHRIILHEAVGNHGGEGGTVAYCDGSVIWVAAADWQEVLTAGGVAPAMPPQGP